MGKLSKPLSEPKFNNTNFESESQNFFETDINQVKNNFLLMQFRVFVDEVLNVIKTSKVTIHQNNFKEKENQNFQDEKNVNENLEYQEHLPEKKLSEQVNSSLCGLIEIQNMELLRKGSRSEQKRFKDAKYIKAAVADELLLNRDWPGKNYFTNFLIETSLFGTSIAGEKIFSKIDKILESPPSREPEIEQMYLFALAIGFEGKYKGYNSEGEISKILNELFVHITRRAPAFGPQNIDKEINDRFVCKQSYQHTISNIKPIRIFRLSKQSVIFVISCIALVFISQFLWIWLTSPLREVLSEFTTNVSDVKVVKHKEKNIKPSSFLNDEENING